MDTNTNEDDIAGTAAQSLQDALERMHANDRKRVAAGEIKASDLHFMPIEMVRESVVDWSPFLRGREHD
jgi:hypothetical protein